MNEQSYSDNTDHFISRSLPLKSCQPRVLVTVSGGVAYVYATEGVEVLVVDFDNVQDAVIPIEYQSLREIPF